MPSQTKKLKPDQVSRLVDTQKGVDVANRELSVINERVKKMFGNRQARAQNYLDAHDKALKEVAADLGLPVDKKLSVNETGDLVAE